MAQNSNSMKNHAYTATGAAKNNIPLGKKLFILSLPVAAIALLTIIGVFIDSDSLISFAGTLALFMFFFIFAFLEVIANKKDYYEKKSAQEPKYIIRKLFFEIFINKFLLFDFIPLDYLLLIRTFFLALSIWVADLYISLIEGFYSFTIDQKLIELNVSIILVLLSIVDTARGKSISNQGKLTKLYSIYGFYFYFRNILLLGFASDYIGFRALKKFLSNPLWFIDSNIFENLWQYSRFRWGGALFIFLILPFIGISAYRDMRVSENVDARNCATALLIFSSWLLSFPLITLILLIFNFII